MLIRVNRVGRGRRVSRIDRVSRVSRMSKVCFPNLIACILQGQADVQQLE
jgi:hypothetical protein